MHSFKKQRRKRSFSRRIPTKKVCLALILLALLLSAPFTIRTAMTKHIQNEKAEKVTVVQDGSQQIYNQSEDGESQEQAEYGIERPYGVEMVSFLENTAGGGANHNMNNLGEHSGKAQSTNAITMSGMPVAPGIDPGMETLLINTYLADIETAVNEFYKEYLSVSPGLQYFNVAVKAVETPEGDNPICKIAFEVQPFVGAHYPIGKDEVIFTADYTGAIALQSYHHLADYPLPSNLKSLIIKTLPQGSESAEFLPRS